MTCLGTIMCVPIHQVPTLLWEEKASTSPGVLVAKWLEYPTGLKEVVGSFLPGTLKILSVVGSTIAKQPSLKADFLSCTAG